MQKLTNRHGRQASGNAAVAFAVAGILAWGMSEWAGVHIPEYIATSFGVVVLFALNRFVGE